MKTPSLNVPELLKIDPRRETERIVNTIRRWLVDPLRRQGAIVAMSGGIDSSVVAALAVRAVGRERVLGLLLPERDCSEDTFRLSRAMAKHLDIPHIEENITPMLEAAGCYRRQAEAVRQVFPEFEPDWKF